MESTRSEKQEGTHGGCCGCDVAHCGSSTPFKHQTSGPSQNNTHHTCVGFSIHGVTTERREIVVVSEWTAKTVIEEEKGCFGKEQEPLSSLHCLFVLLLVVHGLVFSHAFVECW